jgi:pimeloyl-ACP methyl ester carboxylesterase
MRTALGLLVLIAVLYAAACVALFFFQRSLIYFPQAVPARAGASLMKLPVPDGDVLVSVLPRAGPGAGALLYFGGNAEDVSASLPELARAFPQRSLYLLHYRGYGGSAGAPSEAALLDDARALFDQVHATHADVLAMGRSLGSGVAVRLAAERPVSRLVLVTPYDSLQGLAAQQFPMFPVRWLLRDKFDSGRHAERISVPTLIVAAEDDEVIPRASTEQLHRRFAPGIATMKVVPRTGHNTISHSPEYARALAAAP